MARITIRFKKNGEDVVEDALGTMIYNTVEGDITLNNGLDDSFIPNLKQVKELIKEAIEDLGTIVNSVQGKIGDVNLELSDLPFIEENFINKVVIGQPNGLATLDWKGEVPEEQLPKRTKIEVTYCETLDDRNELDATAGDVAIVNEQFSDGRPLLVTYIYTSRGDWSIINKVGEPKVTSVNGREEAVVLSKSDVGLEMVENLPLANEEEAREYLEPNNSTYMTPLRTKNMLDAFGLSVTEDGDIVIDQGLLSDYVTSSTLRAIIRKEKENNVI